MDRTLTRERKVVLYAEDPISRAGIGVALRERGLAVADAAHAEDPEADEVALVVVDEVDEAVRVLLRRLQRSEACGIVLVVARVDDQGLFAAVEAGVGAVLRRTEATPDRLSRALHDVAAGHGSLPPDLLGRLMSQVGDLHAQVLAPNGMHLGGLSEREVDVLRLVADGHGTAEIAQELSYSERTIKNVIQGVTSRLQLRNRSHAVAYALRHGLL